MQSRSWASSATWGAFWGSISVATICFAITLLGMDAMVASASDERVLALCEKEPFEPRSSIQILRTDGTRAYVALVPPDELIATNCETSNFNLEGTNVAWLGLLPPPTGDGNAIALVKSEAAGVVTAEWQDTEPQKKARQLVPLSEALPPLRVRAFGLEERVQASIEAAKVQIGCERGAPPAGLRVSLGRSAYGADLQLALYTESSGGFRAQVQGTGQAVNNAGDLLAEGAESFKFTLPQATDVDLIIGCPAHGGQLALLRASVEAKGEYVETSRKAWVWEERAWEQHAESLIRAAKERGIKKLYIAVSVTAGSISSSRELSDFVSKAHAHDVQVAAVEGDPAMTSGEGREYALLRARAIKAYNDTYAHARLDGVQYDIEPYLDPGFPASRPHHWSQWASTLKAASDIIASPVEAVVPFWILDSPGGLEALDRASPRMSQVTVMAYRTEPAQIVAAAAPVLSWGTSAGIPVSVALESGRLANEDRKVYVKAPEGDLHVIRLGDVAAVVLLERVRKGDIGRTYKFSHTVAANNTRISFQHDDIAAVGVANSIERSLSAWPAFNGIAFHGLDTLTPPRLIGEGRR